MGCLILEKEAYDKWISEDICYDLDEDRFVTLAERYKIVLEDYSPYDSEFTDEDIDSCIEDNLSAYPNTWREFRDRFWVNDAIKYRSKSGDDIVVIPFEDE